MAVKYRVSADIGGTFTDLVIQAQDGEITIGKVPTTGENPALGVLSGIDQLVEEASDIDFFVHGTTVGLNAFLERRGARTLLLMTKGVSDTYTIARGHREELYKLHYRKPEQLVPRSDVHEVTERLNWDGSVETPLEKADFVPIIEKVKAEGIKAVAVCFLHAYANPEHELRARDILQEALPGVSVSLSHSVASEWREYERASSTVMDAYVAPVVELYLETLKQELVKSGMDKTVHIMSSAGGAMTDRSAAAHPISTLLSGPVGGSIGGCELAKQTGLENLLCVDMGGTSFDLSLVIDGEAQMTSETVLEGLPLLMSIVAIETVGAGGGSVAWIEGGGLRVGPRSAGSYPGPVCYGRGGTEPTVTDANLFLGRLGAESLLDGKMTLDMDGTQAAMKALGDQVGLSEKGLAEGIIAISNAKMADAMRTITVGQGIDPRDFTLVAFGGAGPMHAVELAAELDIKRILIPPYPGTFSAWGMLQSEIRHDLSTNFVSLISDCSEAKLQGLFDDLIKQGEGVLTGENVADDRMSFERSIDLRYLGQEYTLRVTAEEGETIAQVLERFHTLYERRYGHSMRDGEVEMINARVAAFGDFDRPGTAPMREVGDASPERAKRDVTFGGKQYNTPILKRVLMATGSQYQSPAIVEEESATTVVPPGYSIKIDTLGNMIIEFEEAA